MHDILPAQSASWHAFEQVIREVMYSYCYREMRTPLLEKTSLFNRSIGEVTDIVEKEMYSFPDRHGESLSLRPENTASCIRAAIEHNLFYQGSITRLWYQGPMFRYERPQKGRYRQFHQVGAEVYGLPGPEIEVELILLSAAIWRRLDLMKTMRLEINTLGTADERLRYKASLVDYFEKNRFCLDEDSLRRLTSNPLRILDSKNADMQDMLESAPRLIDILEKSSRKHFDTLQDLLSGFDIDVRINPRLVRGLDYYSQTVFEWVTDQLGAQGTCCAGGRYDSLTEQLGGKLTPAVGWAMGVERILSLIEMKHGHKLNRTVDAYLVIGENIEVALALSLAEALRKDIPAMALVCHTNGGSFKSQFKKADKSGAEIALILAEKEFHNGSVTLKFLRENKEQITISRDNLAQTLTEILQLNE